MKLNPNFIIHNIDGQTLLVPTAGAAFHGLVQGNSSVEFILNCLRTETDEETIVAKMREKFLGSEDEMREDAASVITQLRKIGAIDE